MARKQSSPTIPTDGTPFSPELESPSAIAAVDDVLAGAGLSLGRRASRKGMWTDGARVPVGRKKQDAERAAATRSQQTGVLHSPLLQADDVLHGFSTRQGGFSRVYRPGLPDWDGDLNLGFTQHDTAEHVRKNRAAFLEALGAAEFTHFGLLQQRHTPVLRTLRSAHDASATFAEPARQRGDALMTNVPELLLTVQVADCVPVLLLDAEKRAVAAIHAGWRGTLARIVERTVGSMRLEYGTDPAKLKAVIGPSIGPASYAVGEEVRFEFESQFHYAQDLFQEVYDSDPVREKYPLLFLTARAPGHSPIGPQLHLNLWEANRQQLIAAGVQSQYIHVLEEDTAADIGRFFSYRAEQGFTGRMMAAIGLTR